MGIGEAVSTCFSKYVTFQGRASRSEFWYWTLFVIVAVIVLFVVLGMILGFDSAIPASLMGLFLLGTFLPSLAVTVRRFHDTDHSGWWYFIQLVPAIGGLWFLYLMVIAGTPGPNKYGS
jgi:uncharacterized membrane protein YhaH (DUF805 family)